MYITVACRGATGALSLVLLLLLLLLPLACGTFSTCFVEHFGSKLGKSCSDTICQLLVARYNLQEM